MERRHDTDLASTLEARVGLPATRIQLSGPFVAHLGGERVDSRLPTGQLQALFAFLVLERHRPVARDELVDALWRDRPPQASAALSALLSRLRKAIGRDRLDGRSHLRLLLPDDIWVDIEVALQAVHIAEAAIARQDWTAACVACDVSFAITSREFLPGMDTPWVDERRRKLADAFVVSREQYAVVTLALGGVELSAAERAAREVIRRSPYRERGYDLLMRALAAQGNVAEALVVYERLRMLLREELGTEPAPALQALHVALLQDALPSAP